MGLTLALLILACGIIFLLVRKALKPRQQLLSEIIRELGVDDLRFPTDLQVALSDYLLTARNAPRKLTIYEIVLFFFYSEFHNIPESSYIWPVSAEDILKRSDELREKWALEKKIDPNILFEGMCHVAMRNADKSGVRWFLNGSL